MFQTAREVRRTFQAFTAVAFVSNCLAGLLGGLWCLTTGCIDDIAARSSAFFIIIVIVFTLVTIQFLFIPAVYLRKWFSTVVAATIPSGLATLLIATLFYRNDVQGLIGTALLSASIFATWSAANLAGLEVRFREEADHY